ncbi:MAG: FAD-dependent oxidoreductase, partial [Rhodothermales bacterium]
MQPYDVAIIGGGIVGLATAYQLTEQHPQRSLVVLEKEDRLAMHQSGRNSGVIHSGIYYVPGSLKAVNCREGRRRLVDFCEREGVAYELCGKVIVAIDETERPRLHAIEERGRQNEITCERIGPEALREREPHVAGVEALYVAEAGIVDFGGVCARLAEIVQQRGQVVMTQARVHGMRPGKGGVTL